MAERSTLIEVYYSGHSTRGLRIAEHLAIGAKKIGRDVLMLKDTAYTGTSWKGATVAFYGLHGGLNSIYEDTIKTNGTLLFFDLGYWGRRVQGQPRWCGYHRVSLNDRHPNAYFQCRIHPPDRLRRFGIDPQIARPPQYRGDAVLVPGMSEKAVSVNKTGGIGEWERMIIKKIRQHTDRPIIYRPKPRSNRKPLAPISGTIYSSGSEDIADVLAKTWCVVTHHSNVAIDALALGIPAISTNSGAAAAICPSDVALVDDPPIADEKSRAQFFYDLAYTQWNPTEMSDGTFWRHMLDEGLIR